MLLVYGRCREFALGSFQLASLAEAREQARANWKLARTDCDPLADKQRTQEMPSFVTAARGLDQKPTAWRNARYPYSWLRGLER